MDHHEIDEIDYVADEVDVLDFVMDDVEADGVVNHVAHDFDVMLRFLAEAVMRRLCCPKPSKMLSCRSFYIGRSLSFQKLDKEPVLLSFEPYDEVDVWLVTHVSDSPIQLPQMVTDTSSAQARKGKDIQGIPWDRLNITRESYRRTRLEQYRNYENIPLSGDAVDKNCKQKQKGGNYYEFFHNTRLVKPTILHFQLRNLVWATSKHDVYLMSNYSLMHWSSSSHNLKEILNFSGHVAPTEKHAGSLLEGFTQTQISTLAVKDDFLVAGGFQGELACKRLDKKGVSFCTRTTYDENAITNAVEIYDSLSGGKHFMASNNDGGVREYDMERFQLMNHFRYPWPVNHSSLSPDRKLIAVVGDHLDGLVVDSSNGKTVASVEGHFDYSFASAWHPDGRVFATGNQDKTCRVWDLRNLSNSVSILKGNMGAVRSVRFSSNGQFLVVAEPADFVHVYETNKNYEKRQEIDFFGEISGVSLSPDDETLYVENLIIELSKWCPKLQKLDMKGCAFIQKALATFVLNVNSLRYLWVQASLISESSGTDYILAMARPFWNMELIRYDTDDADAPEGPIQQQQPSSLLAYYSLAGQLKDFPDSVIPIYPPVDSE
ncbi:uncharacterized WD repeat-containing protein-like protein isoform X1 [Tanacetum coccineum]